MRQGTCYNKRGLHSGLHSCQKRLHTNKNVCFWHEFPKSIRLHKHIVLELSSRILHYTYSFVIQRITCKKIVWNHLLGKSHFSHTTNHAFVPELFAQSCPPGVHISATPRKSKYFSSCQLVKELLRVLLDFCVFWHAPQRFSMCGMCSASEVAEHCLRRVAPEQIAGKMIETLHRMNMGYVREQ